MTATELRRRIDNMNGYLATLYDVPFLTRGGVTYPVQALSPDAPTGIDAVLGPPPISHVDRAGLAIYNYAHLHTLQNSGRNLFDGVTFTYKRLRQRPLLLEAELGTYYDMLATCGALKQELWDASHRRGLRLPMRQQFHRAIGYTESLTTGAGRSAALGGAVLVVYNDAGIYRALLAQRSRRNATDPGHLHVIPAFIYQPRSIDYHPDEWRFSYHIRREYLEELFGLPEAPVTAPHDHFYQHPALVDLDAMLHSGAAELWFSGFCMELTMLRVELCALLLIHDADWWPRVTAPGSPIRLNAGAETDDGHLYRVPIADDDALLAALPPDSALRMVPQAAAALWQGVDLARQRIALREASAGEPRQQ